MELKSLFTFHEKSRNLYKKFLKVFNLEVDTSSKNRIVFINKDTQTEIEFYFINRWIKYSIRYYDKNKDKMFYVYNYFWNRKEQTEFYFIGGDSDDIDYYITSYVNSHWFCVSLLKFCSVLCSKEVADVIGTNYFIDKYDELDEGKKSVEKIILENIGSKYMFCIKVLGNSVVKELEQLGYFITIDNETLMIFEHKETLCKIVIKQNNGNYTVNFENRKDEKFLKNDWYLGNNDGVCCTDIFTIMEKPEFKKFADVSFAWQDDTPTEKESKKQIKTIFELFFKIDTLDDFIKTINKHGFVDIVNNANNIILVNNKCDLKIELSIDDQNIWCKDLSSGIQNCIGTVDDKDEDKLLSLEKTLSLRVYQRMIDGMPKGFENVRVHKGTEPKFTQEQEQNIIKNLENVIYDDTKEKIKQVCDNMADLLIYKNQKYGNSALYPQNIFYKGDTENSILIRIDDKLGRIINNTDGIRVNDVCDIIGYLVLYLVFKNVSKADIEKLKD